jgi:RNA polymerase-binding transcription factor DksA
MNNKEQLLALKQELSERVTKIHNDLHSRKTSGKFSEQVTEGQNNDVLLNLQNEAEQELALIENALKKVANNVYGKCEKCHEDICTERLDAIPFTPLCKECAQ